MGTSMGSSIVLETCLACETPFKNKNLFATAKSHKGFPGKQKHGNLILALESKNMAIFCKSQGKNRQKSVQSGSVPNEKMEKMKIDGAK